MNPAILSLVSDASAAAGDGQAGTAAKSAASGDTEAFRVLLEHRLFAAQIASKAPVRAAKADAGATTAAPHPDGAGDAAAPANHPALETKREPLIDLGPPQSDSGESDSGDAPSTSGSSREAAISSSIQSAALQTRFAANTSIALQIDTFNIQSGTQAPVTQPGVDAQISKILASISSRSQIAATVSPAVQAALLAPLGNAALLAPQGNAALLTPLGNAALLTSLGNAALLAPPGDSAALTPKGKTDPLAAQHALEAKISKLLESGASQADIIGSLAAGLATSVSGQLGLPNADALGTLQTIFATALEPANQTGESGSVSGRARSLAQRFIGLERVASTIASGQSGQRNRIAGNLLDAPAAKDIPAQTTTSDPITTTASVGLVPIPAAQSVASSATAAGASQTAAPVASAQPAAGAIASAQPQPDLAGLVGGALSVPQVASTRSAGDGRTVRLGSTPAIATGGDTGLGRTLTRASLAADARETPVPASAPNSASMASAANSASMASAPNSASMASAPNSASMASAANSASTASVPNSASLASAPHSADAGSAPVAGSSGKALSAFVKSFEAALKGITTLNAPQATRSDAQPAASSSPVPSAPADTTASLMPAAAPFTIDRAEPVVTPPAAPAAPIDHSAIADQVLRGAFMRNVGESSEIRLRLVPDSLGDVNVKLVVGDGTVTAHVVAETAEVRDALVAAQPQLTRSLADAGLKLTGFTVDVSGGGFAGFAGQPNGQSQNGERSRRWANSADPNDTQEETRLEAIPSFGPPVAPRANPGDFNYLA